MKKSPWRTVLRVIVICVALALLIQLVPYGRNHTNPPVTQEPNWDSPQTRALAKRACFDCHSNETAWPWYTNVAPASWLTQHDVEEGRQILNFSEWGSQVRLRDIEEVGEVVLDGKMPPLQYTPIHPEARLSAEEKQTLATGLENSLR
jgi:mono/diheme cytochrome c family protein